MQQISRWFHQQIVLQLVTVHTVQVHQLSRELSNTISASDLDDTAKDSAIVR